MNKKFFRIIGAIMLAAALAFLFYAFGHPEMFFPWGNRVSYALYVTYLFVMVVFLIAPVNKK